MNSSMIGKIEKAHRYAKEPERVRVQTFQATFKAPKAAKKMGITFSGLGTFDDVVVGE